MGKHIDCIDRVRECFIMYKDIPIAKLIHEYCSLSGEFDWVIKPIWSNWDEALHRYNMHITIAGIDETLHLNEYIRNYNPEFVTQRTIPEGRSDLFPILEQVNLHNNDLFEVLCRTHGACGNDDLYVSRTPDKVIDINTKFAFDVPDATFKYGDYGWI